MLLRTSCALALLLAATPLPARAQSVGLARVDLLSEDPGLFLNYDLPGASGYVVRPALRFVEQVKLVWRTPWQGVSIGTSFASQSVVYERSMARIPGLSVSAGVQTKWLLPRGLYGGLAYRISRFRLAAGVSVLSGAAWSRFGGYASWRILPTLGLGIEVGEYGARPGGSGSSQPPAR